MSFQKKKNFKLCHWYWGRKTFLKFRVKVLLFKDFQFGSDWGKRCTWNLKSTGADGSDPYCRNSERPC